MDAMPVKDTRIEVRYQQPNAILEKPWSHISADFITKLPLAQEYDAILVVCDRFSKMAHFMVTTEKTSAEELAKLFRDHV